MVLTWLKWISALVLAGGLAIPITTLVLSVFYFPIFVFAAIGIFANVAPLLLLAAAGLCRLGITVGTGQLLGIWQFFGTVWIGCAYGLSRWGDVGSVFGGQNTPYLEMLFAPWFYLFGQPTS